jgi:hypothetical protein
LQLTQAPGKDLFDTTSFEVAKAHCLMWFYFLLGGESGRALYYVSLALRVCENLGAERTMLAKHALMSMVSTSFYAHTHQQVSSARKRVIFTFPPPLCSCCSAGTLRRERG